MDPQVRNFRDFLQLYNRITELCFSNCVNNFFNRDINRDESACLDKCVRKYTQVNQRIMNVYVEVQTHINERRLAELDAQAQIQPEQAIASIQPANDSIPPSAAEDSAFLTQTNATAETNIEGAVR